MTQVTWLWGPRFHLFIDRAKLELQASCKHLAVDGGALARNQLPPEMIESWWAVGDGDSAPASLLDEHYSRDKDQSDLTLALKHPSALAKKIRAIGLSGGRPDHHMIVLGCLHRHLEHSFGQIRLDDNWHVLSAGQWRLENITTSICSLISLEAAQISLNGAWHWQLHNQLIRPLDDLLLSNQITPGELRIKSDKPIILWRETANTDWWEQMP